jgi:arylsulfatase A-like enzyme
MLATLGPPFSQNGQPHWIQDFFRPANEVLANAQKWIDDGDPRPWFCMINLYDAHWPYRPEAEASEKWVESYDGLVDGFHMRSDHYPRGEIFGIAPNYGFGGPGVLIQSTAEGSPASQAGLLAGDTLLQLGEARTETISDFKKALGLHKTGDVVATRYSRGGIEASVSITLAKGYQMQPRDDTHLRELYDAELSDLDVAVDHFLASLDLPKRNTAVLMCADHGEAFGEGGRYEHNDILEPQVRVPFLVRLPGVQSADSRRVSAPVSGVDVAPTLLALAGIAAPANYTGINALSLVDPAEYVKRPILVEDRDQLNATDIRLALYDGSWKLVRRGLGTKIRFQLFDLDRDPIGLTDVLDKQPELAARMKIELDELRARWHADDKKDQEGTGFSNADALKGMGYTGN